MQPLRQRRPKINGLRHCWSCDKYKKKEEFYISKNNWSGITCCKECFRPRWNDASKRAYKKYPERFKARALARAKLNKQPCEVCGELKVHAHHPFGYDGENALKVTWLCPPHHREKHYA